MVNVFVEIKEVNPEKGITQIRILNESRSTVIVDLLVTTAERWRALAELLRYTEGVSFKVSA